MPVNKLITARQCTLFLALSLCAGSVLAQPPHARGQAGHHQYQTTHNHSSSRVVIEEAVIRTILRDNHMYVGQVDSLPPGIRKNLARGKPLPPGIARQLDSRLVTQLPHYPGYDWRRVGRDLVLIAVTTAVVEAILDNVF